MHKKIEVTKQFILNKTNFGFLTENFQRKIQQFNL